MKIIIPHIHKIEGEMGVWAEITKKGKIQELKIKTLGGLRQIEGILIGRRFWEVPLVVSRVCGICPVVHILNSCAALEKALNVKVSETTVLLRKLMLSSQIVQSHTLHLFFLSLADFFRIENDLDLMKKFPKETKAALKIRDFSLKIIKIIGGRAVHPITSQVGGFSKLPEKEDLRKVLKEYDKIFESAKILPSLFKNLDYPNFERKTNFVSLFSRKEYSFYPVRNKISNGVYQTDRVLIHGRAFSIGDFFSTEIEEELKTPPVKRVKFRGQPYMLGAIARMKNSNFFLNPQARRFFEEFKKERGEIFSNIFFNLFYQAVEVLHFLEESEKLIKEILKKELAKESQQFIIKKGPGLSAMEAPRGTLFTYFELDKEGRVLNCNIITPTAQFLNNLEADLKAYLPNLLKIPEKERKRKIRSLVRVYDPCISCATH